MRIFEMPITPKYKSTVRPSDAEQCSRLIRRMKIEQNRVYHIATHRGLAALSWSDTPEEGK